ncbi:DUF4870 family protein [Muricoccus radiodurans]|uniref:DUF4870 family protein n=1 Tax=Muricoccus radiodurans TaxID=2231721 RepID=UPI003CEC6B92
MSMTNTAGEAPADAPLRNITIIVHALYAASLVLGFTGIVGVVIAYLKRDEARGTIWESHMTYAIRTFWWSLLLGVIVMITSFLLIGLLLVLPFIVWYVVRIVRPILRWNDSKPIANPTGFF